MARENGPKWRCRICGALLMMFALDSEKQLRDHEQTRRHRNAVSAPQPSLVASVPTEKGGTPAASAV